MIDVEAHLEIADRFVRAFFLTGYEQDDIRQEARVALVLAARAYRPAMGVAFPHFAAFVIRRRLVTLIREGRRPKRHSEHGLALMPTDVLAHYAGSVRDAYADVVAKQDLDDLVSSLRSHLSELERRVIVLFATGHTYADIRDLLDVPDKTIDNAIQRARTKLRRAA